MTNQAPQTFTFPIPFGTYSATSPQYVKSKDGSVYVVAVGSMGGKQPWRGRVWRIMPDGGKPEVVFEVPGAMSLVVSEGKLLCLWVDPKDGGGYNAKIRCTEIAGYIHPESAVSSTTVNIDDSQISALRQQLGQATTVANQAKVEVAALKSKLNQQSSSISELASRVAQLQNRPSTPNGSVNTQEIADLVWAKMWDSIYLLRMGMNAGFSSDVNIAGWINDLTAFIRKVSNGK